MPTDIEKETERKKAICKTGQSETDVVFKFGDKFKIQIWQTNVTSDFSISCYFWATKNGNFPKPVAIKEEKLTKIVSAIEKVHLCIYGVCSKSPS